MPEACLGVEKSLSGRTWRLRLDAADECLAEGLAQTQGLDELAARVLVGRGITIEAAEAFLNPTIAQDLPDPSLFKDMDKAAIRLADAIEAGEKVAVFGDYDVDGATSAALLVRYFRQVADQPLEVYIPDRQREGYGPNTAALQSLKESGAAVVITVDCGTMAFEPLAAAQESGLDVIVADHHKAEPELPAAFAVINPNRMDEENEFGNLAAVGVVFLLLVALNRELRRRGHFEGRKLFDLLSLLDIVALGTVADVVALTGLNRTFVAQGLKVMAKRQNIGLRALADVARLDGPPNTYHLGFLLGPRVNAGGRVGESSLGAELLTTEDETAARRIALTLDIYNKERQKIEAGVEAEAIAQVMDEMEQDKSPIVFAYEKGWHPGVIGIVAGRLREKFGRPALVFSIDEGGIAKGSARSMPGVDIGAAVLDAIHHKHLTAGGGHAMAAGLTCPEKSLNAVKKFLEQKLAQDIATARENNDYRLDGILSAKAATLELMDTLEAIGPYGQGHPAPRFAIANVQLAAADIVGRDHIRLILSGADGGRLQAVAFRAAEQPLGQAFLQGVGKRFHVAGRLKRDEWQGRVRVDLQVEDAALAS